MKVSHTGMSEKALTVAEVVKRLRGLEKHWPKGGLMLMANGHFIYLCNKHPEDGGRVIDSFQIPCDGGDPDWAGDRERDDERPKKLVNFKPPRSQVVHAGPRPNWRSGKGEEQP
jgi:hypothetical protein